MTTFLLLFTLAGDVTLLDYNLTAADCAARRIDFQTLANIPGATLTCQEAVKTV